MSNIKFGTDGWRGRVANTYPFAHLHHRHKDACTENTTVLDMINITVSHNPPHNGGIKVYNDHIASYTLGEHRSFQYADKFSNHSMEESMGAV